MKKFWFFPLLALLLATQSPARASFKLEKNDTVEQVYKFASGEKRPTVKVDNVFGTILVSGHAGPEVRLKVKKRLRADSESGLQKAEREVQLDIQKKDGILDIRVDGPFRRRDGCRGRAELEYSARYDFELQVPERADLVLKTITDGDIRVRNVKGDFTVRNVNGHIEMEGLDGSGSGETVNGHVHAAFTGNPRAACSFKTVNGDLQVRFVPGLSADFRVKTFHGDVYSDFPVSYRPLQSDAPSKEKGRYVYRTRGYQGVRVGNGGREITLNTLNGDIVIAGNKTNQGE